VETWWHQYRIELGLNEVATAPPRIYLATDEPNVIAEARATYPQYTFLTTKHDGRASGEGERKGIVHTENVLSDVFHLALCNFFVGTASSQVSRLVYERQQTYGLHHHNWKTFASLDSPWYFP